MLALTPREVYQQLRDAALGIRPMTRLAPALSNNLVRVEIEGWQLLLDVEGKRLHHCERCQHPDGRHGSLETWQRYGTDPVSLLSTWELAQIERLLDL
ncbi:hypothetical protein H8F21_03890 [Pseudomonas sp. P66]|jgi:hypothetical protein|uniref:DUF7693 domain-containing protein n=1 Tax=Pseudomonas arcuscaelestis TaxID=2710591 RepID=A0ABS2BUS7_9PSED|nr:hypothetical protein [Pseudomonas arcuscaelestis]MBM3103794.1 hypothetical protein [Pseudomonas arcuscaelestis]MBM3111288.1 hypothetical protein [Pseudomonas arcuscaelestis]MBM5456711.1 hypothetical protein [Pseudomonas arcuscaelestis]